MNEMVPHKTRPFDDRDGQLEVDGAYLVLGFLALLCLTIFQVKACQAAKQVQRSEYLKHLDAQVKELKAVNEKAREEHERNERMKKFYQSEIDKRRRLHEDDHRRK